MLLETPAHVAGLRDLTLETARITPTNGLFCPSWAASEVLRSARDVRSAFANNF
jgi:hypothetical protein